MELIMMIGIQGSGKSTYIDKHLVGIYQILCMDDIRLALGDIFNKRHEPIVRAMTDTMARAFMERGLPLVVDATNTSKYIVEKWKALADEYRYELSAIFLDTPIEVCKERKLGINKLTEEVFDRTSKQLDEFKPVMNDYFSHVIIVK